MILEKVGQIVKIKGENNVLGLKDYFKKLGLVGQSNWTKMFKTCSKNLGTMLKRESETN